MVAAPLPALYAYTITLVSSRPSQTILPTTLGKSHTFRGFCLGVPVPVLPPQIRTRFRSMDVVAIITRSPGFDRIVNNYRRPIQTVMKYLFVDLIGLSADDLKPMMSTISSRPLDDLLIFPIFKNDSDSILLPDNIPFAIRRKPFREVLESVSDPSVIEATVVVHQEQLYRIDSIANDMLPIHIPGRRGAKAAHLLGPVAEHFPNSHSNDLIAPLFLVVDDCQSTCLKSDVFFYLFSYLHIVPHVRHCKRIYDMLLSLSIDPVNHLDYFRRVWVHTSIFLPECRIRIHDYEQARSRCDMAWNMSNCVSSEWVYNVDDAPSFEAEHQDHDGFNRTSFLGNAVLSFLVASHLFATSQGDDEGVMSQNRAALINQDRLVTCAQRLKLHHGLMSYPEGGQLGPKTMTSLVYVLFGALYRSFGMDACRDMLSKALFDGMPLVFADPSSLQSMAVSGNGDNLHPRMHLAAIQKSCCREFSSPHLISHALTHQSAGGQHQQRLEFLGDSVLQVVVSDILLGHFPDIAEGQLTLLRSSLVKNSHLWDVGHKLDLPRFLIACDSASYSYNQVKMIADAVEALIGSMYLDGGFHACQRFICQFVLDGIDCILEEEDAILCPKNQLQELFHSELRPDDSNIFPVYTAVSKFGSDHQPVWTVDVSYDGVYLASGIGATRKIAEKHAARSAINSYPFKS